MNRLSKVQEREKAEHVHAVREKQEALEKAIEQFNAVVAEASGPVETALEELNGAIRSADEWRSEISTAQEEKYDNASERWQESDRGNDYQSWKEGWGTEFAEVELEFPDELEAPDCTVADDIENLPDEPG